MVEVRYEDVPDAYMVDLKGKKYITHDGLMWLADRRGGISRMWVDIAPLTEYTTTEKTSVIKLPKYDAKGESLPPEETTVRSHTEPKIVGYMATAYILPEIDVSVLTALSPEAQVRYLDIMSQPFVEHANADSTNTNDKTRTAMERMASTRALNRALRLFLRSGQTTWEEIPDAPIDDEPIRDIAPPEPPKRKKKDELVPELPPAKAFNVEDIGFVSSDKLSDPEVIKKNQMANRISTIQEIGRLQGINQFCRNKVLDTLRANEVNLLGELDEATLEELKKTLTDLAFIEDEEEEL